MIEYVLSFPRENFVRIRFDMLWFWNIQLISLIGEVIYWSGDLYENFYLDLNSNSFNEQLAKVEKIVKRKN